MSLQFSVSSAILYGRVDEDTYVEYANKSLQELIKCCKIKTDPEYDHAFTKVLACAD